MIRPQIPCVPDRVTQGRRNHDYVAAALNQSPWLTVPDALPPEDRAPDSIQFNLDGFRSDDEARASTEAAAARGVKVQIFGLSTDNARAFRNWGFIPGETPDLPQTKAMLMRACDVRLPARLTTEDCDFVIDALLARLSSDVKGPEARYGT